MGFPDHLEQKKFYPLKVEKYLENFHTHPTEHQRVCWKGYGWEGITDNDSLMPCTCACHASNTHPSTDISCSRVLDGATIPPPKKVKKFYAFKLIFRLPEAI